jgi:hypothetical protein
MVRESRLESTDHGLVPCGEGWFVLNARHASWRHEEGRSAVCDFEGDSDFSQLGININILARVSRWRCTTGRQTRRTSSCSQARRC